MSIPIDTMRSLLWETLRSPHYATRPTGTTQYESTDAFSAVPKRMKDIAKARGFPQTVINDFYKEQRLSREDDHTLRVLLSELAVAGIIVFGRSLGQDPTLPAFQITEHGKKCLKEGGITPYDPQGYLDYLKTQASKAADDTVLRYIGESLECLRSTCFMACVVMLGGATEQVFLLLAQALHDAMNDPTRQKSFEKKVLNEWGLKKRFDGFRGEMARIRTACLLPKDLEEDLDLKLDGIFSLLRQSRNDAGHPSGRTVTARDAHGNLLLFPTYCKRAHDLILFFESQGA